MINYNFSSIQNLSKIQKSNLLSYIKVFSKKHKNLNIDEIYYEFLNEQDYLKQINQPKFDWIYDLIENKDFEKYAKQIIFETISKINFLS